MSDILPLRKTLIFTGKVKHINWSNKVKRDKVTPKSSPKKRYKEYVLSDLKTIDDNTILLHELKVNWIEEDLPKKIKRKDIITFSGMIVPYIVEDVVSYKITNIKTK